MSKLWRILPIFVVMTMLASVPSYAALVFSEDFESGADPTTKVPNGWTSFTMPGGVIPVFWYMEDNTNYTRFIRWPGVFDGGIYKTVPVTEGEQHTVTVTTNCVFVEGDPALPTAWVGFDPTGGTDPSLVTEWFDMSTVGAQATFTATGATATIFLRGENTSAGTVCFIDWDDVEVYDAALPPITITGGPDAVPANTTATVTWTTDVASDSKVEYGLDPENLVWSTTVSDLVTSHTVNLSDLAEGRRYFYRVISSATDYATAISEVFNFVTIPSHINSSLIDGSFESGALAPNWYLTHGTAGWAGIIDSPWSLGGWEAQHGSKFLGQAASYGIKKTVTSQFVYCTPGQMYVASGWIRTSSYAYPEGGGVTSYVRDSQCNIGIDPSGLSDPVYWETPVEADRLVASPAVWFQNEVWDGCSTQIEGTDDSTWGQISVVAQADPAATWLTVHLLMHQSHAWQWNFNAFDNVTLAEFEPITDIVGAKQAPSGIPTEITGIVSGTFMSGDTSGGTWPDSFVIEEADRSTGIRVAWQQPVMVGDVVHVVGVTGEPLYHPGERVINATEVTVTGAGTVPEAFSIAGIDTGGGDFGAQGAVVNDAAANKYAVGINNVGILMKIVGKVTANVIEDPLNPKFGDYFYVDDAYSEPMLLIDTGVKDGSGNIGIKCRPPVGIFGMVGDMPAVGDYVEVTGVMGVRQIDGKNARYFWTVDWAPASFTTRTHNHVAKWSLLSLPSQPKFADPAIVFGSEAMPDPDKIDGRLYRWDAPTQSLGMYDMWSPDLFGAMNSSEGYWLNAAAAGTISYTGYTESTSLDRWISAPAGWKLMGNPFTSNTQWADWKATDGTAMKSIQDASQYGAGWMQSIGYWWNDSTQSLSDLGLPDDFPQSEQLNTWYGYWVKTSKALGLVAPSP